MNKDPDPREPVPGQPFEPYCRFDICEPHESHTPTCRYAIGARLMRDEEVAE